MKQKLVLAAAVLVAIGILTVLNAVSYVKKPKTPDSEAYPNRSSFHAGPTGTLAWYSLLAEGGRPVSRWRDKPAALNNENGAPDVLVILGPPRREISNDDSEQMLRWVAAGGRLVVVDRGTIDAFLHAGYEWRVATRSSVAPELFSVDPADQRDMTLDAPAAHPVQPTVYTTGVNAIQPSRFAAALSIERAEIQVGTFDSEDPVPPPDGEFSLQASPLAHFASDSRQIVVDMPVGRGRIIFVSDPFIVSNAGIRLADNAQLALNLTAGAEKIAFDEYHQGFGIDNNRFLEFFAGTPVPLIGLQLIVLVGAVLYSQSRRFARPVDPSPDNRLSKLEYVSAMAELQQRTGALDLALESVYRNFVRRASRFAVMNTGFNNSSQLAAAVAERTGMQKDEIEDLFFRCEEIIRGEAAKPHTVMDLANAIRHLEQRLGLSREGRGHS